MLRMKLLVGLAAFVAILFYRAYIVFTPDKTLLEPCSSSHEKHSLEFNQQRLQTFQKLLQFQTISFEIGKQNVRELEKCRDFLKEQYRDLLENYRSFVQLHEVAHYSLVYAIQGKNSSRKPFLFSAHMDVVPAGNLERWKHAPFEAYSDQDLIYARGTLDDKGNLFTMMEALREYLEIYGQPSRTFYVAITHDEEVGRAGATGVSQYLSQQPFGQNGQFEFVLDEGTVILEEAFPTLVNPVAIIGVAEKGYLSVEYRINTPPGHSSMPTTPSAIGIVARAVNKLENTPQPSQFGSGPEMSLLLSLAPYLKFPLRLVMCNLWLFGSIVQWVLSTKPGTDALQRSTTAVTLISGGEKDNVLPTSASATVNHRLHTADSCRKVLENNRRMINDDRLTAHVKSCSEPSAISPYGSDVYPYRVIEQTIRQTFEQTRQPIIVVPGLMLGGTDSRSYINLSKNIYRFSPFIYRHDDLNRLHGDNERIHHSDIQRGLNFYFHLIVNSQLEHLPDARSNTEL